MCDITEELFLVHEVSPFTVNEECGMNILLLTEVEPLGPFAGSQAREVVLGLMGGRMLMPLIHKATFRGISNPFS